LANIPVTRLASIFAAPTSFRQNMRTNPATAAKADATGIRESGPIYTVRCSSYEGAGLTGPSGVPAAVQSKNPAKKALWTVTPICEATLLQEERTYKTLFRLGLKPGQRPTALTRL